MYTSEQVTYASMAAAASVAVLPRATDVSVVVLPRANAQSSASSTPFRMFRAGDVDEDTDDSWDVDDDTDDCISAVTESSVAPASDAVLFRANAQSSASSTPFRMFRAGDVDDDANDCACYSVLPRIKPRFRAEDCVADDCISDVTIGSAHRPNRSAPKREIVNLEDLSDLESEYDFEEEYPESIS